MAPAFALPEPGRVLEALEGAESALRHKYLHVDGPSADEGTPDQERLLLEQSAAFLELLAVSACLIEASRETGTTFQGQCPPELKPRIRSKVIQTCGLDPDAILPAAFRVLSIDVRSIARTHLKPPPFEAFIRAIRSILEACPIEHLQQLGSRPGWEGPGHRCSVAYEALKAFVVRNDDRSAARFHILGRAYAQGALSAEDISALMDIGLPDAVAQLEERGYRRTLDAIGLTDESRTALLRRMRQDRLARGGSPAFDRARVIRDVIASERIEGVDVRSWIMRDAV